MSTLPKGWTPDPHHRRRAMCKDGYPSVYLDFGDTFEGEVVVVDGFETTEVPVEVMLWVLEGLIARERPTSKVI